MPKKQTPRVGRPPSPFPLRTPVRHDERLLTFWKLAAARSGLALQDWIRAVLEAESARPVHVSPLGGRRRG